MELPLKHVLYTGFVMVLLFAVVAAYPDGAPLSVCDSMMPKHGAAPQKSRSPYTITLNATTYSPKDVINGNVLLY